MKQCNTLLTSQPDLYLASALKCIALIRLDRKEEANTVIDGLIKSQAAIKNVPVLTPLCMALTQLDRMSDEVKVLEIASKASPNSVDIGSKALTAMIKAKEWQKAQQTSLRLHKLVTSKDKSNTDYFWSSMQAYSLVASDPSLPGSQLALPLAQRMIVKQLETHPIGPNSDEIMFLYATILRKMGATQKQEALNMLNSEERGRSLCKRSMTLAMLRFEVMEECQDWKTIYNESLEALEGGDRSWSRVQEAVKGAVKLAYEDTQILNDIGSRFKALSTTKEKDRTLRLAPLYLFKEVRNAENVSSEGLDAPSLLDLVIKYYKQFGTKACAYEDLAPFIPLLSEQEAQSYLQILEQDARPPPNQSFGNLQDLYLNLNACKLARLMQSKEAISAQSEYDKAKAFFFLYLCAIPIGKDLPKTEMQPADDYALLSVQALVHASVMQRESGSETTTSTFNTAIVVLTLALQYSPRGYRLRVLLIQLLRQIGAVGPVRKEYEEIGVKSIQQDTLGWILASRASTLLTLIKSDSSEVSLFANTLHRLRNVWKEGKIQIPQMISKAFENGIFSRVEELVDFGEKLSHSKARWLHTVEIARSKSLSKVSAEVMTQELQACRASLLHGKVSDQQDYHVLLNLMPNSCPNIEALTSCGPRQHPGLNYLKAMLLVALVHQGQESEVMAESVQEGDDLTETEFALYKLAVALMNEDDEEANLAIARLLEIVKNRIDSAGAADLPCTTQYPIAIALEGYHLLFTVRGRREDSKIDLHQAQIALTSLTESFNKKSISRTLPAINDDWALLLNKLPSSLRGGDDGQTLLRKKAKELTKASESANSALVERLEAALNAL